MEHLSAVDYHPYWSMALPYAQKPYRFACVNKFLWIASGFRGKIGVISLGGDVRNPGPILIKPNTDLRARSLLQINQSEVLMASGDGLFVLNMIGYVKYKVSDGEFADVAMSDNYVLAIEINNDTSRAIIHKLVYNFNEGKLKLYSTVASIQSKKLDVYLTFLLNSGKIYTANYLNNMVHVNRMYGDGEGKLLSGKHISPLVSYSDTSGSVLICNYQNHTFQVVNSNKEATTYKLGDVDRPLDFVIIQHDVFIMWKDKALFRLSKYPLPILG